MANHESVEEHESEMKEILGKLFNDEANLDQKSVAIQEIHHRAYTMYRDQKHHKAADLYRILTTVAPLEAKYWKGLAASLHMKNDFAYAIKCYICSQILNKGQPDPYVQIHAADCYFALGQVEQGLMALEGAKHSAEELEDEKVLEHVSFMKEQWSRK